MKTCNTLTHEYLSLMQKLFAEQSSIISLEKIVYNGHGEYNSFKKYKPPTLRTIFHAIRQIPTRLHCNILHRVLEELNARLVAQILLTQQRKHALERYIYRKYDTKIKALHASF